MGALNLAFSIAAWLQLSEAAQLLNCKNGSNSMSHLLLCREGSRAKAKQGEPTQQPKALLLEESQMHVAGNCDGNKK